MKTIAVILPINNPQMLMPADLRAYDTSDCRFKLYSVDTPLTEIKTIEEIPIVLSLVISAAKQAQQEGTNAIVVYAFGELGIQEIKELTHLPATSLGIPAIHQASLLSKKKFTIIPAMLESNGFLEAMVRHENLTHNYVLAKKSPEVSPGQIRNNPEILEKLIDIASHEITENNVDTLTMGCGGFIGLAQPLEAALQKKFGPSIHIVDPIETAFNTAKKIAL